MISAGLSVHNTRDGGNAHLLSNLLSKWLKAYRGQTKTFKPELQVVARKRLCNIDGKNYDGGKISS